MNHLAASQDNSMLIAFDEEQQKAGGHSKSRGFTISPEAMLTALYEHFGA